MTLYSADVLDIAKPVPKKGKGKKNIEKTVEPVPEPVPEAEVIEVKPPKKAPTEKQLAALAKAQESRKRKREETEKAKQALIDAEKQKEEKKAEIKEKRKTKKIQKVITPPPSLDEEIDRAVEEFTEKPVKKNDDNEPPSWFKQYVSGVKREEAKISREKKPKKQIQQEAVEVAQKNWSDSFTRDRVRNEVDGHMSRMYQMMFAGRRMK